ncbi:DUF3301 domain-containing protein [Niveibacterium sp. SC-1]|uniref:DUF3301 domain-containing protein n=1 Tax=Niveibacterium sp. SC-1 TaxID=3135646 RepID=UPI00311DC4A7
MELLIPLALLAALVWFWIDTLSAREVALAAGRRACEQDGYQFLDETVAVIRTRFARNERGTLCLRRDYAFEFSEDGYNRRRGSLTLVGRELVMLYTGPRVVAATASLH